MKTSDRNTLDIIIKHKEYFDDRLVMIASSAENTINLLHSEIASLRKTNRQLSHDLRVALLRLEDKDKEIERIHRISQRKSGELDDIKEYLKNLEEEIKKEKKKVEEQARQIEELTKKNNELYEKMERKIRRLESSNSTNSNMGTYFDVLSHTVSKANANTRKKSGLKRGGQKGHTVHRSRLSDKADEIIEVRVEKVPAGAVEAKDENGNIYYATQEIDLVMKSRIIETRYYECAGGQKLDESIMNKYAINSVTYTPHFKAAAIYMNQKGTIPYQRLCEMVDEISGGEVSLKPSTVVKWNNELHDKSFEARKEILQSILEGYLTHVDETGIKISGTQGWMHAITNEHGSYFVATEKRGDEVYGPVALLAEYEGILVHDHFRKYLKLMKCIHAECNAHIDRYLKSGIDIDKNKECEEMLGLLHEMLARKIELLSQGKEEMEAEEIAAFEERYLETARRGLEKYYSTHKNYEKRYEPEYVPTFKRMIAYKDEHLRFIKDFRVPYTNNAAERQCRVVKTKKKISGQFVSMKGADAYADALTILQTSKIRKQNTLANLESIFS